jgi:hypothetical protein
VFPALARQAPEGGLVLSRTRHDDTLARRAVQLAGPHLLQPGGQVQIRASFRSYVGRLSLTLAAVVVAVPLRQPQRTIRYRFNLLGAVFVHRPKAVPRPAIAWVRVSRVGEMRRRLTVHVRNGGDAPAFVTSVRFRTRTGGGRMAASVAAVPGFVAPHSARNFRATLFHRLPAGRLRVEAVVRWGTRATRRSAFFRA